MPNQDMPKSAYAIYKAAFREQKRTPITVSVTTYVKLTHYITINDMLPTPMQLANSSTRKWSQASHMRTDGYDDARSASSHHCPKSRQGAVANDVAIERIGTPHTTLSQQA